MGTQPQPQPVQDTLKKVDQAMTRLQEIQCTISGGSKLCGGVPLSPRSTRGYLRTSLRCKQESLRMKELAMMVDEENNPDQGRQFQRSSSLRRSSSNGEWRRWSMPAFLIQQAVGEIMEASNLTKEVAHILSNSIENKPTESLKSAATDLNENPLDNWQKESSCDSNVKHFLDEIERQDMNFREKAGLQTFGFNQPENVVYNFEVISKDPSSTLKYHRKIEKQEYSARARAESPKLGIICQGQMSFQASDEVKKEGGMERSLSSLPVSHYSSPVKFINDKKKNAKPLVKVEQIRPARKAWISRSSSTKAIMFPNPVFVSSPLKNYPKIRNTNTSMKRNSLPSLKDLTSLRITDYPCYKEEKSGVCTIAGTPKLRKSSSFSAAHKSNASNSIKQSPMSSLLNRTLKKFHVVKCSTFVTSQAPSKHDAKTKFEEIPSLEKSESLRLVSSSHVQVSLGRRHSMSSCDQSAECKVSRLSKQPIEALVQPPKKRSSVITHPRPSRQGENVVMKVAEEGHKNTDSMFCELRKREISASSSAEDVRKQGASWIQDHYMESSVPTMENISVNEMHRRGHVQECNNPFNSPKQTIISPISMICTLDSFGRHENNTDASKEKLNKNASKVKLNTDASNDKLKKQKKIKLQRKENINNCKEDGGESETAIKKSSGFLKQSWPFRCEELGNGIGGLPFLRNVKEWMRLGRSG